MIRCRQCGSTELHAVGVVSDTVGAKCAECGTGMVVTIKGLPDEQVDALVDQIFVNWKAA